MRTMTFKSMYRTYTNTEPLIVTMIEMHTKLRTNCFLKVNNIEKLIVICLKLSFIDMYMIWNIIAVLEQKKNLVEDSRVHIVNLVTKSIFNLFPFQFHGCCYQT